MDRHPFQFVQVAGLLGFQLKKKKKDQGQKKNTNEAFFGGGIDGYEYQYIFQNDWYAHLKS